MSIMNHSSVDPARQSSMPGPLRLTRGEVRMLQYYRALSEADREAVRCLLNALQGSAAELRGHKAHRPSTKPGQWGAATIRL